MGSLNVVTKLFNRRWWLTTLVVIAGVIVLINLGFWQLDRLDQRRAYNHTVADRWNQPPFDLNANALPPLLDELEYRRIQAAGEFDYANQILLTQQIRDNIPGVVLVTPLVLDNNQAVLVARGWVPGNQAAPEFWPQFEEAADTPVIGLIQETQLLPSGTAPTPPATPQTEWFRLNIDAVQPQMPYDLLPVFIYQLPEEGRAANALPYRAEPLALDEGSHFSYAIQWFMFALILGVGYFFFINHIETRTTMLAAQGPEDSDLPAQSPAESLAESPAQSPDASVPTSVPTDAPRLAYHQAPPQKGHP
ncbi:MAG: SURF1 family protein [Litorilinea sp.]